MVGLLCRGVALQRLERAGRDRLRVREPVLARRGVAEGAANVGCDHRHRAEDVGARARSALLGPQLAAIGVLALDGDAIAAVLRADRPREDDLDALARGDEPRRGLVHHWSLCDLARDLARVGP